MSREFQVPEIPTDGSQPPVVHPASVQHLPGEAWERVGDNRFQPKRIKGSLLGRELG